jgi:TniQ
MARLGGVDPAALAVHAFVRDDKHAFEYRGERLVRFTLRRGRVHICPACLLDDIRGNPELAPELAIHTRAAWLIDVIKTCPVHDLGLAEVTNDMTPSSLHDFVHHVAPVECRAAYSYRRCRSSLRTYARAHLLIGPRF